MPGQFDPAGDGNSGLTFRAVLVAIALTLFLSASSAYIALKLGALPWPIIFSVIVSGGILKLLQGRGDVDVHEVNVAQAGASVGGLVAAGVVFTIPGVLFLNRTQDAGLTELPLLQLILLTVAAGLLGVLLSVPLKKTFVDDEALPYPSGTAGAELLLLGAAGGRFLYIILLVGAAAGVFALLRDIYLPAGFAIASLGAAGIFITLYPMPLAVGSGFILGGRASLSWFAGAVVGWIFLIPLLIQSGLDPGAAKNLAQNLGMGLVLGSGIGFFAAYVVPRLRKIFEPFLRGEGRFKQLFPVLSLAGIVVLVSAGVAVAAAALTVLLVWMLVAVAARMTGETNINPLEQFGIFAGLIVALLYAVASLELPAIAQFTIVIFVSVACAVAGDVGHDYKSAGIVGTRFTDIVRVDLIAVVFAGIAAPLVYKLIESAFADILFTEALPAPQAQLVAGSVFGFAHPGVFLAGFGVAFLFEIWQARRGRDRLPLMMMPFGIGLFLGMGLALPLALGALIRLRVDKVAPERYRTGVLVAAGIMGGEGIAGFSAGALTTAGLPGHTGAWILIVLLTGAAFAAAGLLRRTNPDNGPAPPPE